MSVDWVREETPDTRMSFSDLKSRIKIRCAVRVYLTRQARYWFHRVWYRYYRMQTHDSTRFVRLAWWDWTSPNQVWLSRGGRLLS